jgi:hypothetical protein
MTKFHSSDKSKYSLRRKKANNQSMQVSMSREINPLDPPEWGPILWKYMHCLAEKLGTSGNAIVDTDQANYMEPLIPQGLRGLRP